MDRFLYRQRGLRNPHRHCYFGHLFCALVFPCRSAYGFQLGRIRFPNDDVIFLLPSKLGPVDLRIRAVFYSHLQRKSPPPQESLGVPNS